MFSYLSADSSLKNMVDKVTDTDGFKAYALKWRGSSSQNSFSKTSHKIKDVFTRFQDISKRAYSGSTGSANTSKEELESPQLDCLIAISDLFSQSNNYFEEAAKLVTESSDPSDPTSVPIQLMGAPGELEGCSLKDSERQDIHKLVILALRREATSKKVDSLDAENGQTHEVIQ